MDHASVWLPDARVVAVAVAIDLVLGDPPNAWHPVAWFGRAVQALLRAAPRRGALAQLLAGTILVALATTAALAAAAGATWALRSGVVATGARLLLEGACLKATFAIRGLGTASNALSRSLRDGDLPAARFALRSLCSRDASTLTASQLAAAAVESVAENISDSVVAPLFFYVLLGLPGAAFYRAANTLDAMIGYHGRFEYLGKVAARLDDVLNWVPARCTALLLLLAGIWRRARVKNGVRVLWRDGRKTESPNAGRPMATMAGLLNIELAKSGHYRLGTGGGAATAPHISAAWCIARDAALIGSAGAILAILIRARAVSG